VFTGICQGASRRDECGHRRGHGETLLPVVAARDVVGASLSGDLGYRLYGPGYYKFRVWRVKVQGLRVSGFGFGM